ncbi:MAG TPA: TIGR02302 family protein [Xanthobacteraceae bacterium]|nr:TIGR02302 family protein [Xanthobacteraceae bacterium]
MTEATLPNTGPQPRSPDATRALLEATLKRARWTIFWERMWPALTSLATAVGLFLALSWLGLWLWLPPLGRAAAVIACAAIAVIAAWPFRSVRLPGIRDALSRLDRGSGLPHRPATAITDDLAVTPKDPYSLALWNAHVERALAAARALKSGWPSPRVARRDPYALRALVLIACVATFFAAGGERWKRITAAFDWHGVVLPANFRVDAWVIPPAYTGKPPLILPGIHPGEMAALPANGIVSVPINSTLVVRSTGKVSLDVSATGGVTVAKDAVKAPAGTDEHRFAIAATGSATLRGAGDDLTWAFNVIPDKPPTIALTKDPEQQGRGSLLLSYRLEDDYGVTEAQATFARKNDGGAEGESPHPLFGPPDFALILPQARTRAGVAQTIKDLTDHPWAGAEVEMTLVARDEGGNVGKSEPFAFRLPARIFVKPLARALVEQRRNLALDANARPVVLTALDALALAPEKFTPQAGTYLGLRGVFWSLVRAKTDDDLRDVAARLWSMAVQLEDGDISDAQANLRNAEEALRQALERGASDEELKALMDQLRAAMDRFMQALAEQLKNSQQLARPLGPNQRLLSQRDLQSMLDRLENLAKNGARDAAKQLLQQLQQMMENLQMASPDMNGDDGDDMMSALDELGDMIRQQQDLRDRTFRRGQDQRQQGQQRGPQSRPGQQGPQQGQQQGNSLGELRQNQQALRDRLNQLLEELKNLGQNQGGQQEQDNLDQLGRAGEAMGQAENDLAQGNPDNAVDAQGRALEALRKGAQSLAQAMQQQMGQGPGPMGRAGRLGQSRADQQTDPLGRPLRGRDYGDDTTVRVPGEIDVQRARRIIEELRKRFGDMARPQEELDYIERLLKDY